MSKEEKPKWTYHSHYRGVVIEHRPGMQRRGFCSIYHNGYAGWRMGIFTHHSLKTAHKHIDRGVTGGAAADDDDAFVRRLDMRMGGGSLRDGRA